MENIQTDWDDSPETQLFEGKTKGKSKDAGPSAKRRCVSSACIACRKRKSKCDGNLPSCAACSSVYHTPCIYDPNSDHRRKGVYKKDIDNLRTSNTTLQTLVHAILNYDDDDVYELVRQIRCCDSLEDVAAAIKTHDKSFSTNGKESDEAPEENLEADQFEAELSGRMSELILDGTTKFIGGTSNLVFLPPDLEDYSTSREMNENRINSSGFSISQWTRVTNDEGLISHLITMYFTWHYAYFTTLSKKLFYRDYIQGRSSQYCSALLVNTMLALGCHFSSWEGAREDPVDSATAGDHFFKEAKRLILEQDEHEKAKLCTVQALALMSVREAGCGREGRGWVYSGMSFRMAYDLGLNVATTAQGPNKASAEEIDARRITIWGCFLFDKCWSNYLGRQPQLSSSNLSVPKFEVFPEEEAAQWCPYTDYGIGQEHCQPARTRAVALQISGLCEISNDLLAFFYHPAPKDKQPSRQAELKRLSDVHTRLEAWRKNLPAEMEAREGQLPQVLLMHMFYQLLFIHLYRPFLKYTKSNSPLPQHVSPRRLCTQAASAISKLLRMYKRSYGLRQICNFAVYIAHSACTIHLLNIHDKGAKRDLVHGLRNLEDIAEGWLCARRTLRILELSANKWHVELPSEAVSVFERTHSKWGSWASWDAATSPSTTSEEFLRTAQTLASSSKVMGKPKPDLSNSTEPEEEYAMSASAQTAPFQPRDSTFLLQTFSQFPSIPEIYTMTNVPVYRAHDNNPFHTQPRTFQPEQTYLRSNQQGRYTSPNIDTTQAEPSPSLSNSSGSPTATMATPPMPIFNGVTGDNSHSVDDNPEWWTQDQSALALGLQNWEEGWDISATGPEGTAESDNLAQFNAELAAPISTVNRNQQYPQHQQELPHNDNTHHHVFNSAGSAQSMAIGMNSGAPSSNNHAILPRTVSNEPNQNRYEYTSYMK